MLACLTSQHDAQANSFLKLVGTRLDGNAGARPGWKVCERLGVWRWLAARSRSHTGIIMTQEMASEMASEMGSEIGSEMGFGKQ